MNMKTATQKDLVYLDVCASNTIRELGDIITSIEVYTQDRSAGNQPRDLPSEAVEQVFKMAATLQEIKRKTSLLEQLLSRESE